MMMVLIGAPPDVGVVVRLDDAPDHASIARHLCAPRMSVPERA
jgi:hypothetical protein